MRGRGPEPTDNDDLLRRLNSSDPGPAWAEFIDRYSGLIFRAVKAFDSEQDRASDCFLHVCEKLSEHGFRRLMKFRTGGKARFSTWLGTVVFNLCVDWHRAEFGRVEMLPAIAALPDFDQRVYRLCLEQGLSRQACFETLRADFPDLTVEQCAEAMARVHRALTPRQRWRLGVQRHRRRRAGDDTDVERVPVQAEGPQRLAQSREQEKALANALAQLEPDQRLLLQLRYRQGLTLKKIGETTGLGDPFRARRAIDKAMAALTRLLQRALRTG